MSHQGKTEVKLGRWVKVSGFATGEEEVFHIVAETDADVLENKIPVSNPLARALLDARIGDTVEYEPPAGKVKLTVLDIGDV